MFDVFLDFSMCKNLGDSATELRQLSELEQEKQGLNMLTFENNLSQFK